LPNCIFPHALFIHYAQMNASGMCTEEHVRDDEGIEDRLEKVIPMRIFGTILRKNDDGTIAFRWAKDKRKLEEYQDELNQHYRDQELLEAVELKNETTYVIRLENDDNYYRCQVSNVYTRNPKIVHLIDYGKTINVDEADFFYFHHTLEWKEEYCFAFAGHCRIADKNQCLQLGLPLSDEFNVGEEVEIFLLSPREPYYAVVSSLRNPEAKLLDTTLTCDLLPQMVNAWNDVTSNHLEVIPAERPTLSLSPKWIHGTWPLLVTVAYIESLDKVAVCDLLCSLRSCILSEYLCENYGKPIVRQFLRVSDPINQIEIGVIVVALDPRSNRYYRARVCEVNASLTLVDLVGIDFPQWKSFNHPLSNIWLLSKTLESLPRMHHYVPLRRHLAFPTDIKLLISDYAGCICEPHSLALLQHYDETLEPQFVIPDSGHTLQKFTMILPAQNKNGSRYSSRSRLSSISNLAKKNSFKKWHNKSKKPVPSFKPIENENAKTTTV
jgi:hypothetical protein